METANSGTGVFYQALPAIGVDGKKIMKLIPVRMVNGEFVQILTSKPKPPQTSQNVAAPPVLIAPRPAAGPPALQPCSGVGMSSVNALHTPGDHPSLVSLLTEQPQQPQALNRSPNFPPTQTFIINNGHKQMVQHPSQLPVTVNSSALINGQCLQIPPSAQILTRPAAEVPQNIKKHILTSQQGSSSSPAAVSPSVQLLSPMMFVSPVSSISPGVNPPGESSAGPVQQIPPAAKPHLKLTQMVSRRPNSPTRWVVEEMGDPTDVNVKPSHSFSVPSNVPQTYWPDGAVVKEACLQSSRINSAERPAILRTAAIKDCGVGAGETQSVIPQIFQVLSERTGVGAQCEAVKDVLSPPSQLQDTLLMCDGKVFVVSKQNDVSLQATDGSKSQQTAAVDSSVAGGKESTSCSESGQTGTAESSPASVNRAAPKSRAERRSVCEVIEVIDLCDEEEPPRQARSVAQHDEDNVIFVSYSPPKPQSDSTSLSVSPVQGKEKECAGSRGSGRRGAPDRSSSACLGSAVNHTVGSKELPDILVVEAETKSPGELNNGRETESNVNVRPQTPPSCLVNEWPDIVAVEAETESPGNVTSNKETENDVNVGTQAPTSCLYNDLKDTLVVETEMESPGDLTSNKETENDVNVGTQAPTSCLSNELKDTLVVETEMESPGDLTGGRETENNVNVRSQTPPSCLSNEPLDIKMVEAETEDPGGPTSSRNTENNVNLSTSCAHILTPESSSLTDSQLRRIHGVTADVRVSLQRIDEAAKPPHDGGPEQQEDFQPISPSRTPPCLSPQTFRLEKPRRGRRPAAAFIGPTCEDRSGDTAVQPKTVRAGRTRKRTMCKCCCPEASSSTRSAEHALTTEPPGKKRAGAKTPAGDHQACRGHTSPRTRSSEELRQRVHIQAAKGFAHKKLMTSAVS